MRRRRKSQKTLKPSFYGKGVQGSFKVIDVDTREKINTSAKLL